MRIGYPGWSIELASGWSSQDDPDCLTITDGSEHSGALQLSSARKIAAAIADQELINLAADSGFGQVVPAQFGSFSGYSAIYEDQGYLWHRYWLRHQSQMVFVTYIVDPQQKSQEWPHVESMLESLRAN